MFARTISVLAGWLVFALCLPAGAATLLETSEVLAANAEAAAQLPPSYQFTLSAAGTYVVTLQDLQRPARLQSLRVIVTHDLQIVAQLEIDYPSATSAPVASATLSFSGTPGTYHVHVLGAIATGTAGGFFSIGVTPSAGGAAVLEAVDSIASEGAPPTGQSVLQASFTVTQPGAYRLNLADRNFPAALAQRNIALVQKTPTTALVFSNNGAFVSGDVATFNVTDAGATYDLFIITTAGAGMAGSYGATVQGGPSNAAIYNSENNVGKLPPPVTVNIAAAGSHTLALTDLQFPEALTGFSAAVIQNGVFAGSATGATPGNFNLNAGPAKVLVYATASTTGALSATLSQSGQVDYAKVHIFDASADVTTPAIYSFAPSQPVTAGTYTLTVADFDFPEPLISLRSAVVQGGAVVHRNNMVGSAQVTLQAGEVQVLVAATPPPVSGTLPGSGMFALTLATQAGATVFESTQGVAGLFSARPLILSAAGRYDVALKDFEFPIRLRSGWLAISRGTTLVAQVIGSSTLQNVQLDAGLHVVNFLGQPAANASYGTFGMQISDSLPPPVVTLTASPASITAGQTATLQWSATNATSCTASGGWSGSKAVSGTQATAALTTNAAFTLECVGPGGRDDTSVTVTVTAPAARNNGGGGPMDAFLLIALLTMLTAAHARERRRAHL